MANPTQMTMEPGQQINPMAERAVSFRIEESDEGVRLYHNQILDQLPGAIFAAATLVWVISSFGRLIW